MFSGVFHLMFWETVPLLCHQFASVQVPKQVSMFNVPYRCQLVLLDLLLPFSYGCRALANDKNICSLNQSARCEEFSFIYKCIVKNDISFFSC